MKTELIQCCFVACGARVGWGGDDSVIADWLLFHAALRITESSGRFIHVWLCPKHAERYGWKNLDLRKVKVGESSPAERDVIANALELLRMEDPEAFDLRKRHVQTLEAMRDGRWAILPTMIRIYE